MVRHAYGAIGCVNRISGSVVRHRFDGYDRAMVQLETPRVVLRQWRQADLESFAALNADPEVMRYFPAPLNRQQSDEFAGHVQATIARQGWGLWAVEVPESAPSASTATRSFPSPPRSTTQPAASCGVLA